MKVRIDRDDVCESLPGIVLVSHGDLAQGMLNTLEMICGPQENICALSFEMSDSPDDVRDQIEEAIGLYPAGCLVFLDILGGSPANSLQFIALNNDEPVYAIAGMSLPLVIEATMSSTCEDVPKLYADVLSQAESAVIGVTDRIAEAKSRAHEDDNDDFGDED